MAVTIAQLFVIGHDACHNSLTPSKTINQFVGRLAFLPSLHSYTLWEYGHNRYHHKFVMLKEKDPFGVPLSKMEYDSLSPLNKTIERFYRSPIGILFCHLTRGWWLKMFVPPPYNKMLKSYFPKSTKEIIIFILDCFLVWFFFIFAVVILPLAISKTGSFIIYLEFLIFTVLVPFLLWNFLMSFVTYLHHTHPQIKWYLKENDLGFINAQVHSSTHVIFPFHFNTIFLFIMEHTAHHLMREKIPFYHLNIVQQKIEEAFPDKVITYRWTFKKYLEISRICKLYDFKNQRWLDFQGNPTSPELIGQKGKSRSSSLVFQKNF